jgi:hypothetical protein
MVELANGTRFGRTTRRALMGVMACTPGGCGVQTGWGRIPFFAPDSGVAGCQIDCGAYQPKLSNTGAYFSSDPSGHFHEIIGGKRMKPISFSRETVTKMTALISKHVSCQEMRLKLNGS